MEKSENKKKISVPVLIINIIVTVLFLFVFVCLLTVMIQTFTGKEPTLFGYRSFVVLTDSMTGTYDKGDVIIVKALDGEELAEDPARLKEGDVVTFIAPEGFGAVEGYTVTHRIVVAPYRDDEGKWYIRTKGDAAAATDNVPVPIENVSGVVLGKSELLAGLQTVLKSKAGFLLIIVIPLVLIALWQIAVFAVASAKSKNAAMKKSDESPGGQEDVEEIKREAVENYIREELAKENKALTEDKAAIDYKGATHNKDMAEDKSATDNISETENKSATDDKGKTDDV